MTRPPIVVDTNVVVAGFGARDATSAEARLVAAMRDASLAVVVCDELLLEYRTVLARPALLARSGRSPGDVADLVDAIARHALVLKPVATVAAPDRGDQFLWNLLAARDDLVLVTADRALLRGSPYRRRVCTATAFA